MVPPGEDLAGGATEVIAEFATRRDHECPPAHVDHLRRALLDTVGCAFAAHDSSAVTVLEEWCASERPAGKATIWTTGHSTSPSQAALLNGTAGHALDWDDVAPLLVLHPSTVLLPALIAMAQDVGASGELLVAAHDVGAAVIRAVTEALPGDVHYGRGWHSTATVGRIAATAALCRLQGLSTEQSRHALGLVATLAGGSLANFGTMTKPLHAGVAARDAVMAVGLATRGFSANIRQLESPDGFFDVFGETSAMSLDSLDKSLARWQQAWPQEWAAKRFPSCYATHRAAEAAARLHALLSPELVRRVKVTVAPGQLRPLLRRRAADGQEAKFSMEYVVALALSRGEVRLSQFSSQGFAVNGGSALIDRIEVVESAVPPCGPAEHGGGYAVVEAELHDGTRCSERVDRTHGDASDPLSDVELADKWDECCAARGLDASRASELRRLIGGLPESADLGSFREEMEGLALPR